MSHTGFCHNGDGVGTTAELVLVESAWADGTMAAMAIRLLGIRACLIKDIALAFVLNFMEIMTARLILTATFQILINSNR